MDYMEVRRKLNNHYSFLEKDYNDYKPYWQSLAEYSAAKRGKFIGEENKAFLSRSSHIIDNTMNHSLDVLAAGLQSGLTNQTTKWFRFTLRNNDDLMRYKPVKEWLFRVENIIYAILARSNFYKATPEAYKELGLFGQPCMYHSEDIKTVSHFTNFTCGEYMLGSDENSRVNSCIRVFPMNVTQLVSQFGKDRVPDTVKIAFDNGNYATIYNVVHTVLPNFMMDKTKVDNQNKPFLSVYYLQTGDEKDILRISGFDSFPVHAPRWETVSNETYGISPAMNALGMTKSVQKLHVKKHKAIDYQADPVWNIPESMYKNGRKPDLLPGGKLLYNDKLGSSAVTSAVQVNFDVSGVRQEIFESQAAIREALFTDLFKMIANSNKDMTLGEVLERKEEKLILLGPTITNAINEFLDPTLIRTYNNADKLNILPPAPPELEGQVLEIEYISMLAQAQQMLNINASRDFVAFVGTMQQFDQNSIKKININKVIDDFADKRGVNPEIVRSDDEVDEMMMAEQKQMEQVNQMALAKQALEGAKTLSEIDTSNLGGGGLM